MTTTLRRISVAVLSLALGAAALVGTAPTAHAAPPVGGAFAGTTFDHDGDPTCALVDTSNGDEVALPANGVPVKRSYSTTGTVTDSNDPEDVTRLTASVTGTARATTVGGTLGTFAVTSNARATASATQGASSSCIGEAEATAGAVVQFQLTTPGWLTITTATSRGGTAQIAVTSADDGETAHAEINQDVQGTSTRRVYLPVGMFAIYVNHGVTAYTGSDARPSAAASLTTTASFVPAGSATAPAAGAAAPYVALGARGCAARTVSATFPSAKLRSKIATTTFYVNGVRRAVVKGGPTKPVVLGAVPTGAVTVKAVVQLKSTKKKTKKGKKPKTVKGKVLTVSRSYVGCA